MAVLVRHFRNLTYAFTRSLTAFSTLNWCSSSLRPCMADSAAFNQSKGNRSQRHATQGPSLQYIVPRPEYLSVVLNRRQRQPAKGNSIMHLSNKNTSSIHVMLLASSISNRTGFFLGLATDPCALSSFLGNLINFAFTDSQQQQVKNNVLVNQGQQKHRTLNKPGHFVPGLRHHI